MKLKYKFMTSKVGDESIAVAVGDNAHEFGGMIKLNAEGEEILKILANDVEYNEIIDTLAAKYDENLREEICEMVDGFLDKLKAEGLLV